MPDEDLKQEIENQNDPETEQAEDAGDESTSESEFDKDRALETIRKQRENEKKLAKSLKEAAARLKAYEDAEKAKADAEKTELEKVQERAAKLEADLKAAQETAQAFALRQAFIKAAGKAGAQFASEQAAEDAFELADLDGVEIDASGKVTGLDDAIKELQKSRSYLFTKAQEGDGQGTPKRNGHSSGKINQEALKGPLIRF